jgi:hypothetical protein
MDDLRYPIGRFDHDGPVTDADLDGWIAAIQSLPDDLRAAVTGLDDAQLDTPYRSDGWTVRQVVHHIGDSHLNALTRFKLALTEDAPTIKLYAEARWAELADHELPVERGLDLVDALHARWVPLLRSLDRTALARTYVHPEHGTLALDWTVGMYAWHGRHHVAHITGLRKRKNWGVSQP